jgi:hypothetical protein
MKIKNPNIQTLLISLLKFLPFNRSVDLKHITSLLNSIMKFGILRVPVIVKTKLFGKSEYYILDGQNMVSALIKADHKEVQCIVVESDDMVEIIETIAILNNTVLLWKIDNYVDAYCYMPGKEDYKLLKVHHLSTGFNYTVSSKILSGNTGGIKNGSFKINCSDADVVTKNLIEISSLFNTNNAKFMLAYVTFVRGTKNYDHKKFIQLAAKNKDSFIFSLDINHMVNAFNQIYK